MFKRNNRLARKWRAALATVPGWLTLQEAAFLHRLAAQQSTLGRCVEIGAYQGRSAIAMASALPAGHRLISVDTFAGSAEHQPGKHFFDPETRCSGGGIDTLPLYRRHIEAAGLPDRVEVWKMTSREAAKGFKGTVSLLFIDADHSYGAVTDDIGSWRQHLGADALIVLHDIGNWEGPTRCAADLLAQGFRRVSQSGTALALRMPRTKEA